MDDPDPANLIWKLVLLFVLILVNAFFAMSEIAVISLNDTKMRRMAEDGDKKAQKILKLTANSAGFLSTIQIGVTLAGFLTSASAAENFSGPLARTLLHWFGVAENTALASFLSGLSLVLVTLIISYFSLVLGELVPKRLAMQRSESISFKVAGILLGVKAVMRPIVWLLTASTNLVSRLFGIDPNAGEDSVTEEEIRMMVDEGEEKGVIEESQKEMINNIFEFDDIVAADVMTHRTDIAAVALDDSVSDVLKLSIAQGYSRIPVYEEELDDIKGIVYVKDLLKYVGKDLPKIPLSKLMRSAYFVPESKRCGDLFSEMTEKRLQMVIVSDEYGGVAGLVTMEDLLESIVGSMLDEYDAEEVEFARREDGSFTIDGTSDLEEIEEKLDITFPTGEYDTIGGFIMSQLGRIPSENEHPAVEYGGYLFTVEQVEDRRIERVRAEKLPDDESNSQKKEK